MFDWEGLRDARKGVRSVISEEVRPRFIGIPGPKSSAADDRGKVLYYELTCSGSHAFVVENPLSTYFLSMPYSVHEGLVGWKLSLAPFYAVNGRWI